ncbi:MAG: YbfB/YjiJ family MFS transporter [Actinomycetota bacterium]
MTATTRILIGGLCACAVALGLGRFAFTPILPLMQAAHGIDTQQAGWLAASNNLGYLIGALWAALVRTEDGRRRVLAAALALVPTSMAAMAMTQSLVAWNLIRLAAGIGSALVFVLAAAVVVQRLAELGRARLSGIHFAGVGLGIVLSGTLTPPAGDDSGAWWLTGTACAVLSAISWRMLPGAHTQQAAAGSRVPEPVAFSLPMLTASYFCAGLGYIVTGTFLVVVVKATPGLEGFANLSWVVVGLAAMPSAAAWGWLAEHRGYPLALILAHLIQAAGTVLLALVAHPAAVLLSAVSYGGTFLGIAGMAMAFGRAITPTRAAQTMGLLTAAFSAGQIIGPVAAAAIAARGGWSPALLSAAAVLAAGVPMLVVGKNPTPSSRRSGVPRRGSGG